MKIRVPLLQLIAAVLLTGSTQMFDSYADGDFDPQPDPPKHWWPGENDPSDQMSRIPARTLGDLIYVPGRVGNAFQFDGRDDEIIFPEGIGNFETNNFTLEFWVKTKAGGQLLNKRQICDADSLWVIRDNGLVELMDRSTPLVRFSVPFADDQWHHFALVRDGLTILAYLDGEITHREILPVNTRLSNPAPMRAGDSVCDTRNGPKFSGLLDELKIYDKAVRPYQIAAGASNMATKITAHPIGLTTRVPVAEHTLRVAAYSPMEEIAPLSYQWYRNGSPIAGATTSTLRISPVDASTAGNYTVVLSNKVHAVSAQPAYMVFLTSPTELPNPVHWWSADGNANDRIGDSHGMPLGGLAYAPSRSGQAFRFDGVDDEILFQAGNFGSNDFTIEFWINTPNGGQILNKREVCQLDSLWAIRGAITAEMADLRGQIPMVTLNLPLNQWTHFAFVRQNSNLIAYVNGVAAATGTDPAITVLANTAPMRAGYGVCGAANGARFSGLLDEIKIYQAALSPDQVRAAARPGPQGPVVITRHPKSVTFRTTQRTHTLSVEADSQLLLPLSYQWYRNGIAISNATAATFTITPVNNSTVGAYKVLVSNELGSATSDEAHVRIVPLVVDSEVLNNSTLFGVSSTGRFSWVLQNAAAPFTQEDVGGVDLEVSTDLELWTLVSNAVRLVDGKVVISDPESLFKRNSFYRLAAREPDLFGDGGILPYSQVPPGVIQAAQEHMTSFIGLPEERGEDEIAWVGATFGPTARYVYDPGYRGAEEPAFIELKVVSPGLGGPINRGYILVSLSDNTVVEFSTEGRAKTERALDENPRKAAAKFLRYSPGYMAMEDNNGNLLASLGTLPALPAGSAPTETVIRSGEYDSETGVRVRLPKASLSAVEFDNYKGFRTAFSSNSTRVALRSLRTSAATSRIGAIGVLRNRVTLEVGETKDVATDIPFSAVRLDVDSADEVASVRVQLLRGGGFRVIGLVAGTDLVRARAADGSVKTYTIVVSTGLIRGTLSAMGCNEKVVRKWAAGTGWNGDQRQYHQPKSDDWCPPVGCGPTAIAMLYGWWDVHGVPSAFYHLVTGFGDADEFRFNYNSLRTQNAEQTVRDGEWMDVPGFEFELYIRSPEELVMHDLHNLCNTFCVSGQGATEPSELIDGAVEYIDRVVKNISSPENEFGEQLVSAWLSYSYTDGYWLGMTDWEGGGVKVAEGIKIGRPGIVGLGDTLFDLHYALAYVYKRVDYYEGCGTNRELVDRRRWFKCNMGWGSGHGPEYHDAESVWFGMTARLSQKQLPQN